jgi:hypothetical protein
VLFLVDFPMIFILFGFCLLVFFFFSLLLMKQKQRHIRSDGMDRLSFGYSGKHKPRKLYVFEERKDEDLLRQFDEAKIL